MSEIFDMYDKLLKEKEKKRQEELRLLERMYMNMNMNSKPSFGQKPLFQGFGQGSGLSSSSGNNDLSSLAPKLGIKEGYEVGGKCFCPKNSGRSPGRPRGSTSSVPKINEKKIADHLAKRIGSLTNKNSKENKNQ